MEHDGFVGDEPETFRTEGEWGEVFAARLRVN